MSRPNLYQRAKWTDFQQLIFRLIEEGLRLLREEYQPGLSEDEINRLLYFCFQRAAHKQRLSYHLPVYEGRNPPDAEDVKRAERELKRPDFYWQLVDDTIEDADRCVRRFVLECKRLGTANGSWTFNSNYIEHGVLRFVTVEHGYGKGDREGGMIGYVQDMDFVAILSDVNTAALAKGITVITAPSSGWQLGGLSRLDHVVARPFAYTPYQILHFWIDLRPASSQEPEV